MNISINNMRQITSLSFPKLINILALTCLFLMVIIASSQSAHAIKKCKDANGKWHYGDVAVRACEDSKVTTLSGQGTIRNESEAPKTEVQLADEAAVLAQLQLEQERKDAEEREKSRILSVYETEGDIDRQRDNQLYSVDSNIAVHNTYLDSIQELIAHEEKKKAAASNPVLIDAYLKKIEDAQENHKKYSVEVDALKTQREEIIEKFAQEKLVYRELTKSSKGDEAKLPSTQLIKK